MRFSHVLWSSATDEWSTPQDVFNILDREFGFTLDPCATADNAKCRLYFTQNEDGLKQDWGGHRVFVNPPYSDIKEWVKKAYYSSLKAGTVVVMLIPARTDTTWFHEYVTKAAEVRFIRGRLKFGGSDNSAPFPSMLVIFKHASFVVKENHGSSV